MSAFGGKAGPPFCAEYVCLSRSDLRLFPGPRLNRYYASAGG